MSDQGFDFKRAPERREKGRFEIPPWEQEAFEELQRRRQEEQPPEQDPSPAEQAAAKEGGSTRVGEGPSAAHREEQGPDGSEQAEADSSPAAAGGGASEAGAEATGPSEAEMVALMARLASEEPGLEKGISVVTMVTAAVLLPTGIMLLVWGMGGMVKARAALETFGPGAGTQMQLAAGTMILFGVGFIVGAMWLLYRYLRQRGVI